MKILKHGERKQQMPVIFDCSNCGCKFEAENEEYQTKLYYPSICFVATCPECEQQVIKNKY